jgi:hypothetical protein
MNPRKVWRREALFKIALAATVLVFVGCDTDVHDIDAVEYPVTGHSPPDGTPLIAMTAPEDVPVGKSSGGLGTLVYSTSANVGSGAWWGVSLSGLNVGYVYIAVVTPTRGNPDAFSYALQGGSYRLLRGSALMSNTGGLPRDESHVFLSDLRSGERAALMVYGRSQADFEFRVYRRKDLALALPISGYTSTSVPISAVMDNAIGQPNVMTLYDGSVLKRDYGCIRYVDQRYRTCVSGDVASTSNGVVLGFKRQDGGQVMTDINYQSPYPSVAFYDEHTGTDLAVPGGTAVYSPMAGTITVTGDAYNSIIIDHGDGWQTTLLHLVVENAYAWNGRLVGKGYRVGTVGGTGGVAAHLHMTIKKAGARNDPYRLGLWRN